METLKEIRLYIHYIELELIKYQTNMNYLAIDIYIDYTYMYVVTFGSLGSNSMS